MFQFVLICSGNLSFLNWLTAIPAIWCFDDAFWAWSGLFSIKDIHYAIEAAEGYKKYLHEMSRGKKQILEADAKHKKDDDDSVAPNDDEDKDHDKKKSQSLTFVQHYLSYNFKWSSLVILTRRLIALSLTAYIAYRSYPVITNILSSQQAMNISFDPFRIVNSYGAFGSITKVRHEVIIQGTKDEYLSPYTKWEEFDFTCKPGNIDR